MYIQWALLLLTVVLPLVAAVPPYQVVEAHPFVEVEMVVVCKYIMHSARQKKDDE